MNTAFQLVGHVNNTHICLCLACHSKSILTQKDTALLFCSSGEIAAVSGSVFDLRKPTRLGDVINTVPGGGYDHNFCISQVGDSEKQFVAR